MSELPAGTVTFLFTDIEGSTTRWEREPEAMRAALARHDALMRQAIAAGNGQVFKTVGDAFYAAFVRPTDALVTCLAAQRALAMEEWNVAGPIRVRMALHTGTPELRDGDYFGQPLNRVARLLGAGHGGQVLLSPVTQELVSGALPEGVNLRDMGEHRLKDLNQPLRIFQIVGDGLMSDFPPLKTLDVHRHNLPVQPTILLGREEELAAARHYLVAQGVRLLTLTGPGGIGKTHLSLQLAADLIDEELATDGVFFVPLADVHDPQQVLVNIAFVLGLRENGDQPLGQQLVAFLQLKRVLLVLDNFEWVLAAAGVVAGLLAACRGVTMLVTSREVLRVQAEQVFPISLLPAPSPEQQSSLPELVRFVSVRLFVQRAQAVKPDFAITTTNARAVAEICARLEGLPLSIELAATRIKVLSPQELLERLAHQLAVLTGGARDLPERHRTLRATLAWSYDLLQPDEQVLFARLSVFAGGCTVEAAENVACEDDDSPSAVLQRDSILDLLSSLVDKNLLRQVEQPNGVVRFVMLEMIREYGQERLAAYGDTPSVQRRHATYFLSLATAAEPELRGARQGEWLARLEVEHDNLRAALRWALANGQQLSGLRLGGALWRFWYVRGNLTEGLGWLEALLRPGDSGADPEAADLVSARARALHGAAMLAESQGAFQRAVALAEESRALWQTLDDAPGIAAALNTLANVATNLSQTSRAVSLYEESLALWQTLGDRRGIASALNNLANVIRSQGDYARAAALAQESLVLRRAMGDSGGIAISLNTIGGVALDEGQAARARELCREALALWRGLGDTWGIANALDKLANAALLLGDQDQARACAREGLTLRRVLGDPGGIATALKTLASVELVGGDSAQALALYEESLALLRQGSGKAGVAACLEELAYLAVSGIADATPGDVTNDPERAARLCGEAAALREAIGAPLPPANRPTYEHTLAAARAALGDDGYAMAWAAGKSRVVQDAAPNVTHLSLGEPG